jgi:cytidyltransferase-like protein
MDKRPTVCLSGYFNPVHIGHIRMFKEASKTGRVIVILNNDNQVKVKQSVPFMNELERKEILESILYIDEVVLSIDEDGTVCKTLEKVKPDYFANGGDRKNNIPEEQVCINNNIKMLFNIGGDKEQSSSWLIENAIKWKEH